ncbi:uncharacterized protein LOC118745524 isoform X2 [Rhagoletis pomonella]|uniref:uncharacterized protein LOC118745524 isoform X2 n=1 Tax=Rhagoletis pomonella TaxID=28610 RepID=UPI00177B6A0A|nr:uncharacterized protein LOC118745524 isoform X2 [Rhagoletis pomonella]
MGNAGSTHRLNLEDVNSEIHSYYKQQQMRRALKCQQILQTRCDNDNRGHWTHSLPNLINNDSVATADFDRDILESTATLTPNCKVLPQLNERLKLRATANGTILYSGGTISGKREQPPSTAKTPAISQKPQPPSDLKQHSRNFINDDLKHKTWKYTQPMQQKSEENHASQYQRQSIPAFRRSQTLLHLPYGTKKTVDSINESGPSKKENNWGTSNTSTTTAATSVAQNIKHHARKDSAVQENIVKLNKYNKKRKAPAAPPSSAVSGSSVVDCSTTIKCQLNTSITASSTAAECNETYSGTNELIANERMVLADKDALENKQKLTKSRLFRSNAKVSQLRMIGKLQEQLVQTQQHLLDTSLKLSPQRLTPIAASTAKPDSYLRREKSSDAILLPHRNAQTKKPDIPATAAKAKLPTTISTELDTNNQKHIIPEQKLPPSKIPQLNRTFHFGMGFSTTELTTGAATNIAENGGKKGEQLKGNTKQLCKKSELSVDSAINTKRFSADVEPSVALTAAHVVSYYKLHTASDAKPIVDNGLFIQLRPNLPRRQPNTPSFSPVAAWRTLVDEQHRQEQQKLQKNCEVYHKMNNNSGYKNENEQKSALLPYLTCGAAGEEGSAGILERVEKESARKQKEAPAQLTCNISKRGANQGRNITTFLTTWTPQQDLGDYNDCDCDEGIMDDVENSADYAHDVVIQHANGPQQNTEGVEVSEHNGNLEGKGEAPAAGQGQGSTVVSPGMHVFSLSLPRDVHTQSHREFLHTTNTSSTLPKEPARSANTVPINATSKTTLLKPKCCCFKSSKRAQLQALPIAVDGTAELEIVCPLHGGRLSGIGSGGPLISVSDNWVLHRANSAASKPLTACRISGNKSHGKWDADVEPISLTYLTAGKHVMYLPGKERNNTTDFCGDDISASSREVQQNQLKQQRRQRPIRQNLHDVSPVPGKFTSKTSHTRMKDSVGYAASNGFERSQRFTFQSTIRLLEKQRLAERLVKDAELREAQRKTELEAMNRIWSPKL